MDKQVLKTAAITFFTLLALLSAFLAFQKLFGQLTSKPTLCQDCNIILITMTNLRYDHMSSNGYTRDTTPNLDKLSKESLVFDNTFSHSSWTLPEAISIYTGLYPYQHGVTNRYDGSTLSKDIPTLVDILNQAGYETAAFTGGFDYNTKFGLTSRFNQYKECAKGQLPSYPKPIDPMALGGPSQYGEFPCTIPLALDWLKNHVKSKFFLHVQGFDAHCPFSQRGGKTYDKNYQSSIDYSDCLWTFDKTDPIIKNGKTYYAVFSAKIGTQSSILFDERDREHLLALYDESITLADNLIGSFLDEVKNSGLLDKTIVIFTSEHGDMFGKYGRFMRGGPLRGTFYDDVLHIPLIIRLPNTNPARIDNLVQHVDLLPTLLNLLGLPKKSRMEGRDLLPLISQTKKINDYIFAGSEFKPDIKNPYFSKKTRVEAVRSKDWKLIEETVFEENGTSSQKIELYDIAQDKDELHNLAEKRSDLLQILQSKLHAWSKKARIEK